MPNPRAGRWLGTAVAALAAAAMAVPAAAEPVPGQATPANPAPATGVLATETPTAITPAVPAPDGAPALVPEVNTPAVNQPLWQAPAQQSEAQQSEADQPEAELEAEADSGSSAPEDEAVDADAINRLLCSLAGSLADDLLVGSATEGAICRGAGEDILRGLTGSFKAPGEVDSETADTASDETATDDTAADASAADETAADQNAADEATTDDSTAADSTSEDSAADDSTATDAAMADNAADQAADNTADTTADTSTADTSTADNTTVDDTTAADDTAAGTGRADVAATYRNALFEDQVTRGALSESLGVAPASRQISPPNLPGDSLSGGGTGDALLGLTDLQPSEIDQVLSRASGTLASRNLDTRILGQEVDSDALLSALSLNQIVDKEQTATLLGKAVNAR